MKCEHGKENFEYCGECMKTDNSERSTLQRPGYGAKPLPVMGGLAIILSQRKEECKDCGWHPDVCKYCEVNKLEDERIEKEMAS